MAGFHAAVALRSLDHVEGGREVQLFLLLYLGAQVLHLGTHQRQADGIGTDTCHWVLPGEMEHVVVVVLHWGQSRVLWRVGEGGFRLHHRASHVTGGGLGLRLRGVVRLGIRSCSFHKTKLGHVCFLDVVRSVCDVASEEFLLPGVRQVRIREWWLLREGRVEFNHVLVVGRSHLREGAVPVVIACRSTTTIWCILLVVVHWKTGDVRSEQRRRRESGVNRAERGSLYVQIGRWDELGAWRRSV